MGFPAPPDNIPWTPGPWQASLRFLPRYPSAWCCSAGVFGDIQALPDPTAQPGSQLLDHRNGFREVKPITQT
jgi:hypothetical protein